MSQPITVRVQSPSHGTKRIQTKGSEKVSDFFKKVSKEFGIEAEGWTICLTRDKTGPLKAGRNTMNAFKVKHGDMLYLFPDMETRQVWEDKAKTEEEAINAARRDSVAGSSARRDSIASNASIRRDSIAGMGSRRGSDASLLRVELPLDEVDEVLEKMDGRIHRSRNDQLCNHKVNGKCLHCVPLEPYDSEYLKSVEPPIKFLSFHSYIRKLKGGVDKGKFAMLENISCRIKPGCPDHPPWPGGICTKCQPNAVTLKVQEYRHVDNVMFENPFIAEQFLNYWRSTGNQRIGYLYGRYEHHKDVPLGIRATVAAIYEPPQTSNANSVELVEDEQCDLVESVAEQLGLRRIGWIFTDLVAEDLNKGTVKCFRGQVDSHFLSSEECIMAAHYQNLHPNPCRLSPDGHFGSKFVTVLVTGDSTNQIHFEGYQVSNQCMALVRDDCLVPTRDVPELGYVRESTNEQYVPDVFYSTKDKYGNEVTKLARPLPVEYLLQGLPAAFPVEPIYTFSHPNGKRQFPIGNRSTLGEIQDFSAFASYMHQFGREELLAALSDFHLLLFLNNCDMLPLKAVMGQLLEAVAKKDEELIHHFSKTEEWQTVVHLIDSQAPSPPPSRTSSYVGPGASPLPPIGSASGTGGPLWTCNHCTFLNQPSHEACDMCGLPK